MTHTLYRFYDAEDRLLYVGLSVNPGRRLEKHRGTQPWWSDVARIEMEQHLDMQTLRAAEREAIETERPLYNVKFNGRPEQILVWLCDECGAPVEDGDGYLTVKYADIREYKRSHDAFDEAHRRPNGWVVYNLAELDEIAGLARWSVLHRNCDPDPESEDYWYAIERVRTYADLLERTAHLLGKTWLPTTTWHSILRRAKA